MPQDFSGQNLRGRNFKEQNLTGANFSNSDIRGANFTNAILTDANFSHAKAGLQHRWTIVLVSDAPEAPKLTELLKQLQAAIETDTELAPKNKEKALKQVKALAEAAQKSTEEDKQDLGDTAITMLKGLISGLPSAAALVEACNKLLPEIASLLDLA